MINIIPGRRTMEKGLAVIQLNWKRIPHQMLEEQTKAEKVDPQPSEKDIRSDCVNLQVDLIRRLEP